MDNVPNREKKAIQLVPVVESMPADLLTPLAVYLKLAAGKPNSFLLESVEGGQSLARYSFIGADPSFVVTGNDQGITVTDGSGRHDLKVSMIAFLRKHFDSHSLQTIADLPPFIGGAIGYLGFDSANWFVPSLRGESVQKNADDAAFMFFRSVVAFDHAKQMIKIITLVRGDGPGTKTRMLEAEKHNHKLRKTLESSYIVIPEKSITEIRHQPVSNWERSNFEAAVEKVKELIRAGEVYQVVLSQKITKRTNASAIDVYRALRSLNPSPYMFLLQFDGAAVVGASPEMLVKCTGRRLEYRPIAGTRPRGISTAEDDALADEMSRDEKEVSEHLMLVDLGRNDLGRVSEYGSVSVDELMKVEKYSHVQHLVSSLSATLKEGLDRFDVLSSCFPAGTVSGAPKLRAIEIIRDIEPDARGVYAGAVGYFDYSGNMDTCIAIRTLRLCSGLAELQAGAGIVADSVPSAEYQETLNKAAVLLKAIEVAEGNI